MKAGRTIIVVDDNEQNRLLVEAQLDGEGYTVVLAESGAEAIGLFERQRFDLVLLDILMPGIDGFETCRRIRRLAGGADIPVLFLTAAGDAATHDLAIRSGGDDFLRKPVERTELLLRVRSLLRITQLQSELRNKHDALVRLQHQKDLLSELLVHDLNNPLSSVIANSQFVLENPVGDDAKAAMEDVAAAAEAIHQMVLNLLDISRAEENALVPVMTDVDVRETFRELETYSRRRLAMRRQRLELAVHGPSRTVRADGALLSRILQNLLDNAMKYSPTDTLITLDVEMSAASFRITLRDHGDGIPADERERIFEKYAQIEGRPPHRSSRGLGLVFCRLATEAHGGKIWVEENPPQGSIFVLEIPSTPRVRIDGKRSSSREAVC